MALLCRLQTPNLPNMLAQWASVFRQQLNISSNSLLANLCSLNSIYWKIFVRLLAYLVFALFILNEPQPLKPWDGVWNATTTPPPCMQFSHHSYNIEGDEDCLYLNVFTPKLPENGVYPLLDVLVYIHGGAFMFSTGMELRPDYVLRENDIVIVFLNYRLGSLGFLSTGDQVVSGNNGLKDQVAALRWIQRNIINFGGNPDSITISGCSAGGASVHYHFLSPLTEGLFHNGMSFSGSTLLPWTLSKNNTQKSAHLAVLVGCSSTNSLEMVRCLRRRPARHILEAGKYFQPWRYSPFTPFGPIVEPSSHPGAFLNEEPLRLLAEGRFKKLPWLISLNKDEGLYPAAEFINDDVALQELDEKWNEIAPHLFFYNFSVSSDVEKANIGAAIRNFYLGDQRISKTTASKIVEALGHRIFFLDVLRAAKLHALASTQSVYCYMFNYRGKYSLTNLIANDYIDYGTSHGDDTVYLFYTRTPLAIEQESDSAVVSFMCSLVVKFMKTGNPALNDMLWKRVLGNQSDGVECLHINSSDTQFMQTLSYRKAFNFWKSILPSEYGTLTLSHKNEL